jgi:hypothetical protein
MHFLPAGLLDGNCDGIMGAQRPGSVQGSHQKRLREEVKAIKADAKARRAAQRKAKNSPKRPPQC